MPGRVASLQGHLRPGLGREHDMRHEDFPTPKLADQVVADRLQALDELSEIVCAIDFAALAVIGMAKELGGEEGELIANHLRDQAERIQKAIEHLSTFDLEAAHAPARHHFILKGERPNRPTPRSAS
jgi:hypothetical protein